MVKLFFVKKSLKYTTVFVVIGYMFLIKYFQINDYNISNSKQELYEWDFIKTHNVIKHTGQDESQNTESQKDASQNMEPQNIESQHLEPQSIESQNYLETIGTYDNPMTEAYLNHVHTVLFNLNEKLNFPTLKEYKNPCWYYQLNENVTTMYNGNAFLHLLPNVEIQSRPLKELRDNRLIDKYKRNEPQLRCMPYVYILGFPKCGTTDLYFTLKEHHQIFSGMRKEYHWWNMRSFGKAHQGLKRNFTFVEFVQEFDLAADNIENQCPYGQQPSSLNPCITLEASVSTVWEIPFYNKNEDGMKFAPEPQELIPGYMYRFIPSTQLMVILRNPITRAYSDYYYFTKERNTLVRNPEEFHNAIVHSVVKFNDCIVKFGARQCAYNVSFKGTIEVRLQVGLYYIYLNDWLSVFPRKQLLAVKMEEYSERFSEVLKDITDYLHLDPFHEHTIQKLDRRAPINSLLNFNNKSSVDMWPETRTLLQNFYAPYNQLLSSLLDDEKFKWM